MAAEIGGKIDTRFSHPDILVIIDFRPYKCIMIRYKHVPYLPESVVRFCLWRQITTMTSLWPSYHRHYNEQLHFIYILTYSFGLPIHVEAVQVYDMSLRYQCDPSLLDPVVRSCFWRQIKKLTSNQHQSEVNSSVIWRQSNRFLRLINDLTSNQHF